MKNIETPSNAASDEAPLEKPDEAPGLETVSESEASAVKKSEEECSQTGAQHSAENSAGEPTDSSEKTVHSAHKPHWGRRLLMLVLLVMLLAAGAAAAWQQVRAMLYEKPAVMTSDMVVVPVLEGDSVTRVLGRLAQAGVEVPIWQAKLLTRLEPTLVRKIHVGRFRFTRGMTPYNVLETLSGPALVDKQLRIPEGAALWTVEDILASAEDLSPESAKLTDDALLERLGVKSMEGASDTATLEGFLAPDTYRYGSGTSDLIVLEQAAARQRRLVDEAWATRSELCEAKTPYELLILASIIEKETGVKSDRHLVSSVFNNRLRIGMPLQTDPTVIYGLGPMFSGNLTKKDLQRPGDWNTYLNKGLPPTPISMPSAASIEAALAFLKSKKLKKPEEALAMAGGSPLAALEPSADDRLSAKTENAVLEFLRAGPELSVDALVRLYAPDLTLPAFSLLVSRWAHDLMRSALGLQPRYFIDENAVIERLAAHTDAKRAAGFCTQALSCRRAADHTLNPKQTVESVLLRYKQIFQ